jgi:hypothetical protein
MVRACTRMYFILRYLCDRDSDIVKRIRADDDDDDGQVLGRTRTVLT